jgi:L-alanine-DL-glutamate epimerase-like enolase superfamily enzyme
VRLARQIVGPEVKLRVDANQALTVDRAIRTARQLEGLNVDWLEEPLPRADVGGYRQLAAATSIPLAAGEREYGLEPFDRLMEARAIAVVQPDLLRVGGVTGWRAVAARAEAAHLRIAPHFYREYDLHLAAACPNLIGIEWFSWLDELLCVPPQLRDGLAVVPETPGFGVEFRRDAIAEYEVHR